MLGIMLDHVAYAHVQYVWVYNGMARCADTEDLDNSEVEPTQPPCESYDFFDNHSRLCNPQGKGDGIM